MYFIINPIIISFSRILLFFFVIFFGGEGRRRKLKTGHRTKNAREILSKSRRKKSVAHSSLLCCSTVYESMYMEFGQGITFTLHGLLV